MKKIQLDDMELALTAGGKDINIRVGTGDFLVHVPNPCDSSAMKNPYNGLLWPYNQDLQLKYADGTELTGQYAIAIA